MQVRFRGIDVSSVALSQVCSGIVDAARARRGLRVSFVNPHSFNVLRDDASGAFAADLGRLDFVIPDGVGVTLACRILHGGRLVRYGFDLLAPVLFEELVRSDTSVFLLGAKPGVAELAVKRLQSMHPGLIVSGVHHGYISLEDDLSRIAEAVRESGAGVVCVGMGAPLQEAWTVALSGKCAEVSFVTCGGYLDQVIRPKPYFPAWTHRLGLNWLVRLIREPGRLWRRSFFGSVRFVLDTVSDVLHHRWSTDGVIPATSVRLDTDCPHCEDDRNDRV